MALASSNGSRILCNSPYRKPCTLNPSSPRTLTFTVSATPKKQSSSPKTGRFDSKNRRTGPVTTKEEDETLQGKGMAEMLGDDFTTTAAVDDGLVMPKLPGKEPDFWEGPQWDGLGFFVEYMWAFGVLFAIVKK